MLASSAPDVAAAMAKAGGGGPVAIDTKLDGIRIQVHRDGDDVVIATRTLDDITDRLPEVVEVVRALPAERVRPRRRGARARRRRPAAALPGDRVAARPRAAASRVTPYFFDLLHLDGARPARPARRRALRGARPRLVPEQHRDPPPRHRRRRRGRRPSSPRRWPRGHEGVVVKCLRRRTTPAAAAPAWVKVKPVHTLDLVVLAVEWGSRPARGLALQHPPRRPRPRRRGFVMLGKTFKGMTDEMLAWQTERFTELAVDPRPSATTRSSTSAPSRSSRSPSTASQRSTRYPGGVALRFARVVRYRDDKTADEADTIETVQGFQQEVR